MQNRDEVLAGLDDALRQFRSITRSGLANLRDSTDQVQAARNYIAGLPEQEVQHG